MKKIEVTLTDRELITLECMLDMDYQHLLNFIIAGYKYVASSEERDHMIDACSKMSDDIKSIQYKLKEVGC